MGTDADTQEILGNFRKLLKNNFSRELTFSHDKAGIASCDWCIDILTQGFMAAPVGFAGILGKMCKRPKLSIRSGTELHRLIYSIDVDALEAMKFPLRGSSPQKLLAIVFSQNFILLKSLMQIKSAIKEQRIQDTYPPTLSANIALVHIHTAIFLMPIILSTTRAVATGGFRACFLQYAHEAAQAQSFKHPRNFWGFLRMETADGAKVVGTYHFEVTETVLRYHEGRPPTKDSATLQKGTVLRYFNESKKILL